MNTALFIYRWCLKKLRLIQRCICVCVWFYMVTFCQVAQCLAKSLAVLDISLYVVSISWWYNCTELVGLHFFMMHLCEDFCLDRSWRKTNNWHVHLKWIRLLSISKEGFWISQKVLNLKCCSFAFLYSWNIGYIC